MATTMDTDVTKRPVYFDERDLETSHLDKVASPATSDENDPFHWFSPEEGRKIKHKIDRRLVLMLGAM